MFGFQLFHTPPGFITVEKPRVQILEFQVLRYAYVIRKMATKGKSCKNRLYLDSFQSAV